MKRSIQRGLRGLILLVAVLLVGRSARSESCYPAFPKLRDIHDCIRCWGPDDYCQKPLPPLPCNPPSCLPDDYCQKPLPPAPCPAPAGCIDDYCRKCCPFPCLQCSPCPAPFVPVLAQPRPQP